MGRKQSMYKSHLPFLSQERPVPEPLLIVVKHVSFNRGGNQGRKSKKELEIQAESNSLILS